MATRRSRRRIVPLASLLAAAFAAAAPQPAPAQPDGALDSTFDGDGLWNFGFPGFAYSLRAVLAAPDGRLAIVGDRFGGGVRTLFWQALSDSTSGAPCFFAPIAGEAVNAPRSAGFDAAGRLLIGGQAAFPGDGDRATLLRYLYPDCTLDATFNLDGVFVGSDTDATYFDDLATDSAGRIVAAGGRDSPGTMIVTRLTPSGLYDFSFAGDGRFATGLDPSTDPSVAVQDDDRIVFGASAVVEPFGVRFVILRLTVAGDYDESFAGDGLVTVGFPGEDESHLFDLAVDPVGGGIVAAGSVFSGGAARSAVALLLPTGLLDGSFGDGGRWTSSVLDFELMREVELQSDGRILVAGWAMNFGSDADFFAYRLTAAGATDTTFGLLGTAAAGFDLGGANQDGAEAATLQGGKLALAGAADSPTGTVAAVARFWSDLIFADDLERGSAGAWTRSVP